MQKVLFFCATSKLAASNNQVTRECDCLSPSLSFSHIHACRAKYNGPPDESQPLHDRDYILTYTRARKHARKTRECVCAHGALEIFQTKWHPRRLSDQSRARAPPLFSFRGKRRRRMAKGKKKKKRALFGGRGVHIHTHSHSGKHMSKGQYIEPRVRRAEIHVLIMYSRAHYYYYYYFPRAQAYITHTLRFSFTIVGYTYGWGSPVIRWLRTTSTVAAVSSS